MPQVVIFELKTSPWGDLWPLILRFLAFWSGTNKSCFFCTSLKAQKIRKVGPRCGQVGQKGSRQMRGDMVLEGRGPWAATRATGKWY